VPVAELPAVPPAEALAAADVLAFVRAGDRWRPGALAARLRTFIAHPTAVLGVAGHVLVHTGRELLEVRAPLPPFDANRLLLCPSIEPAAVLVRPAALDESALALVARPHGDARVWSELVRAHGLLPSTEIAADVALDPERHGHAPDVRTRALLEAVAAIGATGSAGTVTIRRELLRRLFVEPDPDPALADVDLHSLLGGADDPATRAVIDDLQWTLARQREALAAERVRWPVGEVPAEDAVPTLSEEELHDVRLVAEDLWIEVQVRDTEIARLKAELAARDAQLAALHAQARELERVR
jgi:hypothetical protein